MRVFFLSIFIASTYLNLCDAFVGPRPVSVDSRTSLYSSSIEKESGVDYTSLTVAALKDELRSRGLKVGGKKTELIERLQEYHQNVEQEEQQQEEEEADVQNDIKSVIQELNENIESLEEDEQEEETPVSSLLSDTLSDIFNEEDTLETVKEKESSTTNPTKRKPKSKPKQRTKAQIKKLKFLMQQDVEQLIQDKNITAIAKALENIDRLTVLFQQEGNSDYKPKTIDYNLLIRAHGKLTSPTKALEVLMELEQLYKDTNDEDIRASVISYTEVIDAYAKSNTPNAAEKAEELLFRMMTAAERPDGSMDEKIAPTSITCDAVLNAWAKQGTVAAAERAEVILDRMEYMRTNGRISSIQPTSYSFATVISAWAKCRFTDRLIGKENAERAQFILNKMNDFRRKIELEEKKKGLDHDGDSNDAVLYSKQLQADTVLYNSVIDAWARSTDPISGTKAEELLFEMEEKARLGDEKVASDTITYNSVINAIANSGHMNAGRNAEKILVKMEKAASENNSDEESSIRIQPNTSSYNQVLKAYTKGNTAGSAQRADLILTHMLQTKNKPIQPDVISFSTVLDVWAKSKEPNKAQQAYTILQKMLEYYQSTGNEKIKPNAVTYNTVLNACAFSAYTPEKEKKQALSIAVKVFDEMKSSTIVNPDAITYGMLIKCFANLVPQGKIRNKMASEIFTKCTEEGLVNGLVFDEIRRAASSNAMKLLLRDAHALQHSRRKKPLHRMELRDLPKSWKINVQEKKPRQRRKKKKKEEEKKPREVATFDGDPIKPMRRIVEQSWQSGRDV